METPNLNIDDLVECWNQVFNTLKEAMDNIAALFEVFRDELEESVESDDLSTPRRYGMSLIRDDWRTYCSHYHYIPVAKRNLPYMRRRC